MSSYSLLLSSVCDSDARCLLSSPATNHPDSNHYAFPLDFMALVDLVEMKVVKIAYIPLGIEPTTTAHTGPRKVRFSSLHPVAKHH